MSIGLHCLLLLDLLDFPHTLIVFLSMFTGGFSSQATDGGVAKASDQRKESFFAGTGPAEKISDQEFQSVNWHLIYRKWGIIHLNSRSYPGQCGSKWFNPSTFWGFVKWLEYSYDQQCRNVIMIGYGFAPKEGGFTPTNRRVRDNDNKLLLTLLDSEGTRCSNKPKLCDQHGGYELKWLGIDNAKRTPDIYSI